MPTPTEGPRRRKQLRMHPRQAQLGKSDSGQSQRDGTNTLKHQRPGFGLKATHRFLTRWGPCRILDYIILGDQALCPGWVHGEITQRIGIFYYSSNRR